MRKKRKASSRPKMQCGICKFVVDTKMNEGGLVMVNHQPDTGDPIAETELGCIGMQFPRLASLITSIAMQE